MLYAVTARQISFRPRVKTSPSSMSFSILLLLAMALASDAGATLRQWTGNAPMDNHWSNGLNWTPGRPQAGDDLLFPSGALHPNCNDDYTNGTTFNSITFSGGGHMGYNIMGNLIVLNAGVRVDNISGSAIGHTINNSLLLNSNQTFTVNNAFGAFSLAGPIDLNGKDLTFDVTAGTPVQVQGLISGAGGLTKTGAGTLTLIASNTYAGSTILNGGTLEIDGSQPASPVVLNAGLLKGKRTVGTITALGNAGPGTMVLSPGVGPGVLTCGNVALNPSTTLAIELNGASGGGTYDQLNVLGSVDLGGSTLSVTLGFAPVVGTTFIILANDGTDAITGIFNGLPEGATLSVGNTIFQISYAGGSGNDVALTVIGIKTGITRTWSGLGTNDLWMNASNWVGNVAPSAGDDLLFPSGAARPGNRNDFPNPTTFNSIAVGGTNYLLGSLSGAVVRLNQGLHGTFASGLSTVQLNLTLNAPQTFTNSGGGELDFINSTLDNSGFDFRFRVEAGQVLVSSFLTGGGGLIKEGAAVLRIGGGASSNYGGPTTVNEGTLQLEKASGSAVNHDLIIGDGLGGPGADIVRLIGPGQISPTGTRATINSSGVLQLDAFASQTLAGLTGNGQIMLGGNTLTINLPAGVTNLFAGSISGPAGVNKAGAGKLILAGTNTYIGNTQLSAGTLQIDGFQPASKVIIGGGGARLEGSGTVGDINASGSSYTIAPGSSPGVMTCGNFFSTGSGTLEIELNGDTPGTSYDLMNVRGGVDLSGLVLSATLNFQSFLGTQFVIIKNDGADAVTNTFSAKPEGSTFLIGGETFQISYVGGDGNDVVLKQISGSPRPPQLNLERLTTNSVRLLWPTNPPGFNLESNTNLLTTNWATASPLPSISGTNNVVTNSVDQPHRFYRLHK